MASRFSQKTLVITYLVKRIQVGKETDCKNDQKKKDNRLHKSLLSELQWTNGGYKEKFRLHHLETRIMT